MRSRLMFHLLVLCTLLLVSACGGGSGGSGGGGGTPPPKTTIAGVASDDLISGGTVTVSGIAGGSLGTGTTAADGSYSVSVDQAAVADGFQVSVTGGTAAGQPFGSTLRAVYGPSDSKSSANVTLLTTMVAALADEQTGVGLVAKRDAAISKLVDLGVVLQSDEWRQLAPASVDLVSLRQNVAATGFDKWLAQVVADIQAGDLSPGSMAGFPNAQGGIVAITVGNGTTTDGFQGNTDSVPVQLQTYGGAGAAGSYRYTLSGQPAWLTIDASGVLTQAIPQGAAPGSVPYSITVANTQTGKSRTLSTAVYVMATKVVASGTADSSGGTISDPLGDYVLTVPAGALSQSATFAILQGTQADGRYAYTTRTTATLSAPLQLYVPDPRLRDLELQLQQPPAAASRAAPAIRAKERSATGGWQSWGSSSANLLKNGTWITNRLRNGPPPGMGIPQLSLVEKVQQQNASALYSLCPLSGYEASSCALLDPVLFVNGYTALGALGGGQDTWAQFPEQVCKLDNQNHCSQYAVFEFDWCTNARFEDVADDLAGAIELIQFVSGRTVHVVAHSFGGLLARTYIQGLAVQRNGKPRLYGADVASLTTIDTPHSGIFSKSTSVATTPFAAMTFPGGQDSGALGACEQLSCDEAGKGTPDAYTTHISPTVDLSEYFGITPNSPGKLVYDLATNMKQSGLPVPTQALIGMKLDGHRKILTGDGVITYAGQRLHPELTCTSNACTDTSVSSMARQVEAYGTTTGAGVTAVKEKMLLFPEEAIPGYSIPDPFVLPDLFFGFQHVNNDKLGMLLFGSEGVNQVGDGMPYNNCDDGVKPAHPSCLAFLEWSKAHKSNSGSTSIVRLNVKVVDSTSLNPITGALVAFDSMPGQSRQSTAADGSATLTVPFSAGRSNVLYASALGYESVPVDQVMPRQPPASGAMDVPTILLLPTSAPPATGSLRGTISDSSTGTALPGVSYTLTRSGSTFIVAQGTTDSSGQFQIAGLVQGTYRQYLSLNAYTNGVATTSVRSGQTNNGNATMAGTNVVPAAPTGVSATAGDGRVTIRFDAVSEATSYNAYMASVPSVTKNNYNSLPNGAKFAGITGDSNIPSALVNGTTYYFVVTAVNANGESSESSEVSATPQVPATVVVTDGDFAAWSSFSFVTDDPTTSTPGPGTSAGSATRVASGGQPGAYLATSITDTFGDTIWTGGIKTDYAYDPAIEGGISAISVRADVTMLTAGATAWQLVIEQAGTRFYSVPFGAFSGGWATVTASGLTAASFDTNPWADNGGVAPDGNRPDFGATAPALRFGYMIGNRLLGPGTATASHGMDNFIVTITK